MGKEEIIKKILEKTNYTIEEIEKKAEEKRKAFKDHLTEEGIYMLIARELGISLKDVNMKYIKIKDIISGMKNINFIGRVIKINPIKEFEFNGNKGRVCNIFVGDKDDYAKVVLWNDKIDYISNIKLNDIIEVTKSYTRENIYGTIEVILGKYGVIKKIEDENIDIPDAETLAKNFFSKEFKKTSIDKITTIGNYEISGTIVKIIKSKNFIYQSCKICNTINCIEHENTLTEKLIIFSTIVDDGYGNIRSVFFVNEEFSNNESVYNHLIKNVLGKDINLKGYVKKNKISDKLEMIVKEFQFL